jgi:large subunit ribosomal protein L30
MAARKKSAKLRIRWVRSAIGLPESVRATIRGLGFRRLNQTVERADTPAVRGMIEKVRYLVEVEA